MPNVIGLDESPLGDDTSLSGEYGCPECTRAFTTEAGRKRHLTRTHNAAPSTVSHSASASKRGDAIEETLATRWSQFQVGCSVLVAIACVTCGTVLLNDAQKDAKAIAAFAVKRPKLRKQLESFLASADLLVLVAVLGNTAKEMASHHAIGARFGMGPGHAKGSTAHSAQERMLQFMSNMPAEARHKIIDQAIHSQAAQANYAAPAPAPSPTAAGEEPTTPRDYTAADREMLDRMRQGKAFESADMMV